MIIRYEADLHQYAEGEIELEPEEEERFRSLDADAQEDFVRALVWEDAPYNVSTTDMDHVDWVTSDD